MKHVKLFEQFTNEKVYQLTGIYGAKGIPGKVLFAFKKELDDKNIKYDGKDAATTLEGINKWWKKFADTRGAKIILDEVLKHAKNKEDIIYITAPLGQVEWIADDANGINKPGRSELLVRIPGDFVINVGIADDVDARKLAKNIGGMPNLVLLNKTETMVLGRYDGSYDNIEIREALFLTIDAK